MAALTPYAKDKAGNYAPEKLKGKKFFHFKTKKIYTVTGFVWNATTDTWNIKYKNYDGDIEFTRTLENFLEKINDIPRFIAVNEEE